MAFSLILSGNCIASAAAPYKLELKDSSFILLDAHDAIGPPKFNKNAYFDVNVP